jgi:hypothetical protein
MNNYRLSDKKGDFEECFYTKKANFNVAEF